MVRKVARVELTTAVYSLGLLLRQDASPKYSFEPKIAN